MKKKFSILIIIMILILGVMMTGCEVKNISHSKIFDPTGYEITFFDDFNGNELDTTKWFVSEMAHENPNISGRRRGGFCASDAVSVKDGHLYLTSDYRKDGKFGEGWYTGWVETATSNRKEGSDYQGFSQNKGYFEIKCKCPPSYGIWSAFWMMPDEGVAFSDKDILNTAEDGCEIDIMESPHYFEGKSYNQHVIHADSYGEEHKVDKSKFFDVKTMYTEFHTYAVEWTEESITYFIDGYQTYTTKVRDKDKRVTLGTPNVLEYIILSCEVGGHFDKETGEMFPGVEFDGSTSWAGNPMDNDLTKKYDFIVDYVKVMQKK